jgi:5-methylcytosine-specific restriction endonuclease McrA
MSRSLQEWIGKTDNTPFPPRVRLRIFARDDGCCQCGCDRKIGPGESWQTDHTIALINGGQNRENNGRTILTEHHRVKTAEDVAEKSKVYRLKSKHLGVKKRKRTIPGRKFDGTPIPARWV